MFKNDDKRKLYWLMNEYLSGKIDAWTFCNQYHDCFDIELDLGALSKLERKLFGELSEIAGRFSPFDEEHKKYPGVYYTEDELKKKVLEVKEALKNQ